MAVSAKLTRRAVFAILCAGLIVSLGVGVRHSFGLFLRPVTTDLGLSREVFGLAIAIQNLLWGFSQPFAGMIADKYGGFWLVLVSACLYAAGMILVTVSADPLALHLTLGVMVGLALSGTSFVAVFGSVARAVPPEKRTLALGLVTASGSFGMFAMVPTSQALIADFGWVWTLWILSAIVMMAPLVAVPLTLGQPRERIALGTQSLGEALAEASRHSGFWLLTTGFFVCGFQVTFIGTHLPAYLADQMIPGSVAATSLAFIGFFNVVGSYSAGILGSTYRKKYLLSGIYAARAVAILLFILIPTTPVTALAFAAAIGFLWLSTVPLTSGLVGQIFGPQYMSTLFGFVFMSHQLGSFFGAWLGGRFYDVTGSYDIVWMLAIAMGVGAAVLHWPIRDAAVPRGVPAPAQ